MSAQLTPENPIHIIYADDDSYDREFFQDGITDARINCNLLLFENGCDLLNHLEKLNSNKPDIIFLDINMPKTDGRVCLQKIKMSPALKSVPVVMLSTSIYEAQHILNEGADLFISKTTFFTNTANLFKNLFVPGWKDALLNRKDLLSRAEA